MNICLGSGIKQLFHEHLRGPDYSASPVFPLFTAGRSALPCLLFQQVSQTLRKLRGSLWLVWKDNLFHPFPQSWKASLSDEYVPLGWSLNQYWWRVPESFPQPSHQTIKPEQLSCSNFPTLQAWDVVLFSLTGLRLWWNKSVTSLLCYHENFADTKTTLKRL